MLNNWPFLEDSQYRFIDQSKVPTRIEYSVSQDQENAETSPPLWGYEVDMRNETAIEFLKFLLVDESEMALGLRNSPEWRHWGRHPLRSTPSHYGVNIAARRYNQRQREKAAKRRAEDHEPQIDQSWPKTSSSRGESKTLSTSSTRTRSSTTQCRMSRTPLTCCTRN